MPLATNQCKNDMLSKYTLSRTTCDLEQLFVQLASRPHGSLLADLDYWRGGWFVTCHKNGKYQRFEPRVVGDIAISCLRCLSSILWSSPCQYIHALIPTLLRSCCSVCANLEGLVFSGIFRQSSTVHKYWFCRADSFVYVSRHCGNGPAIG